MFDNNNFKFVENFRDTSVYFLNMQVVCLVCHACYTLNFSDPEGIEEPCLDSVQVGGAVGKFLGYRRGICFCIALLQL